MLKKQKNYKRIQSEVKVQDLIKILQTTEKLFQSPLGKNDYLASFIKKLRRTLSPYRNLNGEEFLNLLKISLPTNKMHQVKIKKEDTEKQIDMENISHDELRVLFSKNSLSKEQLLLIGERRFGLSRGTIQKLKKEEIQDLIESAIQNIETLSMIERKAAE